MNKELFDFIQYLSKRDKKTLSQKALKVSEEQGELAKVVLPYDNAYATTHRFITDKKILEESVDIILCAMSIAYDLGFTHDDLEDMMTTKSTKWLELQDKEDGVKDVVPYEMHVTIKSVPNVEYFKRVCGDIGVKPIVLELEKDKEVIVKDFQTSSNFFGDNRGAYVNVTDIANKLRSAGFEVIREKIETIPWHQASPRDNDINPTMPKSCYFESHISVIVTKETKLLLESVSKEHEAHLSRNFFKKLNDNEYVNMVTLRSYTGTYEQFLSKLEALKSSIKEHGFNYEKEIIEFAIYDTKLSHDFNWLNNSKK